CAVPATASLSCVAPLTTAGSPKPTSDVPGETPRSPLSTEGPVLVTLEAPRTTKGFAVPRLTADALATAGTAAQARPEASRIPTRRACARRGGLDMSHFPY